jgi:hypothetical protein
MAEKKSPEGKKSAAVKDLSPKQGSQVRGGSGIIVQHRPK